MRFMPRSSFLVCIDAGHGLSNRRSGIFDPGATAIHGGKLQHEADWNLCYANCIEAALAEIGIPSVMTRRIGSHGMSLRGRVKLARQVNAGLLLSVHFNADAVPGVSAPDGKVKGFEVLYTTPGSRKFALRIFQELAAPDRRFRRKRFRKEPVYREHLRVLSYDPSVLIEFGFLDDPEDFALISNPQWMDAACRAVARAIVRGG